MHYFHVHTEIQSYITVNEKKVAVFDIAPIFSCACLLFFYRCEEETSEEVFSPVQDLLDLIASFTLFGKAELKVALCVTNPQPPGFKFDPPLTTGTDAPRILNAPLHLPTSLPINKKAKAIMSNMMK